MADKRWRDDASDYMSDDEYNQYQQKKAAYAKSQQDPDIQALAQSYKGDMPSGDIYDQSGQKQNLGSTIGQQRAILGAEGGMKGAQGYAYGGFTGRNDPMMNQGGIPKDPKQEALKKLRGY